MRESRPLRFRAGSDPAANMTTCHLPSNKVSPRDGNRGAVRRRRFGYAAVGVLVAFLGRSLPAQDVATGLVMNLTFDGTTADSSVNRFTFSEYGTMRYVADRFGVAGRALEFVTAPADSRFVRGTGPALANQSQTVAFWIKKNGQSPGWLLALGDTVGASGKVMIVAISEGAFVRYTFFMTTSIPHSFRNRVAGIIGRSRSMR